MDARKLFKDDPEAKARLLAEAPTMFAEICEFHETDECYCDQKNGDKDPDDPEYDPCGYCRVDALIDKIIGE